MKQQSVAKTLLYYHSKHQHQYSHHLCIEYTGRLLVSPGGVPTTGGSGVLCQDAGKIFLVTVFMLTFRLANNADKGWVPWQAMPIKAGFLGKQCR